VKSSTATATTVTAETPAYVGRFAPSPTGDLHLGSLLTAAASFLDARAHGGRWLLRIEDLDTPREVPGAHDAILRGLEAYHLHWDGPITYQSQRRTLYVDALSKLEEQRRTFHCRCSRRELQSQPVYPGTCRRSPPPPTAATAMRFILNPQTTFFSDRIQGPQSADASHSFGDFVIRRRDGLWAYMLAVVVDDADQGVTHVVRGADLLGSTAAQIQLQQALGYRQPDYAHVPVLTEPDGNKLAKSRRSPAVGQADASLEVWKILILLGMQPPAELRGATPGESWSWARGAWDIAKITRTRKLACP
jgi:glutamyl-Q tRNA(Asp) synthetase